MSHNIEDLENEGLSEDQLLVYIAGPYTHGRWGDNISNVVETAQRVVNRGHVPFIPHTMTALWSTHFDNNWVRLDLCILERCDAMIRLEGKSKGADIEEEFAEMNDIPVYHGLSEFKSEVDRLTNYI